MKVNGQQCWFRGCSWLWLPACSGYKPPATQVHACIMPYQGQGTLNLKMITRVDRWVIKDDERWSFDELSGDELIMGWSNDGYSARVMRQGDVLRGWSMMDGWPDDVQRWSVMICWWAPELSTGPSPTLGARNVTGGSWASTTRNNWKCMYTNPLLKWLNKV